MKHCYYCGKPLAGFCHYVVLADGKEVPVCADDRTCKPHGMKTYGHKPKTSKNGKIRALERNRDKYAGTD